MGRGLLRGRNRRCSSSGAGGKCGEALHRYLSRQSGTDEKATDAQAVKEQREESNDRQKAV